MNARFQPTLGCVDMERREETRKKRRVGTEMSARVTAWGEEAKASAGPPPHILLLHNHAALEEDNRRGAWGEISGLPCSSSSQLDEEAQLWHHCK